MKGSLLSLMGMCALVVGSDVNLVPADEDVGKDMVEIATTRGYSIENHYVTTADGYILGLFRIPNGKNFRDSSKDGPKPVAILQHGLLDSSYTWVNNYEYQSLGYILADNGFDVWFGNNRGNRYSRNHTTLDPSDGSSAFWEFTWDEMATGDLPAIINYVIDTTGVDSVGYVGHSEGTIQMFAAATSTGENEVLRDALSKVNLFVALAPVTYVSNMGSRLMVALADADVPAKLYDRGDYEFLAYGPIDQIAPKICRVVEKGCDIFLMALCGPTLHVNASRIQVYVSETPAGTSMRNMMHWVQGVEVPTFQKFDWGSSEANMQHYGVGVPPLYDLSKLSVPTALFAGQHDYLGDPTDVQKILDEAPKEKIVYYHMTKDYAHLDFVWADDAYLQIYPDVLSLLLEYSVKE